MPNLPQAGVDLEAQSAGSFLSDMGKASRAVQDFFTGTQTGSADASKAYAKLEDAATKSLGQITTLTGRLDIQKRTYEQLQAELTRLTTAFGDDADETKKAQLALDKMGLAIQGTERSLATQRQALGKTQEEMASIDSVAAKVGRAFGTAGDLIQGAAKGVDKAADVVKGAAHLMSGLIGTLGSVGDAIGGLFSHGAQQASAFGEVLTGALRRVGELATDALVDAGRATADFVKSGIGAAGDVEQTLNVLQVVGGATSDQMAQISRRAVELGADLTLPATSAVDASRAMLELGKAGLNVNDTMAAAKGTLQLAAAGQLDEAEAAKITATALNSFGLSGDKASKVADLLAASASASSIEVVDTAASFRMAAAVFSAFQGPAVGSEKAMVDLTAAITILGKAGITGSDAGTSLKQMLLQLTGPTQKAKDQMRGLYLAAMSNASAQDLNALAMGNAAERAAGLSGIMASAGPAVAQGGDIAYDAAGKMRPLAEIVRLVSAATRTMNEENRAAYLTSIFGADATRAIVNLMRENLGTIDATGAAISKQGAASELAGAQMKGWNGVIEGFNSQLETIGLIIGQQVLPLITPLGQKLNEALGLITSGDFGGAIAKIGEVVREAVGEVQRQIQALATGTSPLSPFIDAVLEGLKPLGKMLTDQASVWFGDLWKWLQREAPGYLAPLGDMLIAEAGKWLTKLNDWIATQGPVIAKQLETWGKQFSSWIEPYIPVLMGELEKLVNRLGDELDKHMPAIQAKLGEWGRQALLALGEAILLGIAELGVALGNWILQQEPVINKALNLWAAQFVGWVNNGIGDMLIALGRMGQALGNWLYEMPGKLLDAGIRMGEGLIKGFGDAIMGGVRWIQDQAWNVATAAKNAAMAALGIGSPSKVFAEIGRNTAQGMQLGLQQGTPAVAAAAAQLASPPAYPVPGAMTSTTSIDRSSHVSMPIYTNQTPAAIQQSWAIVQAVASGVT